MKTRSSILASLVAIVIVIWGGSVHAQDTIQGKVTYGNSNGTPLPGIEMVLYNGSNVAIDTAYTDQNGQYEFITSATLPAGTDYWIGANSYLSWGSYVSYSDVFYILMHAFNVATLNGIDFLAADVTGNGTVSFMDAWLVSKRIQGQITSFPAGDWQVEEIDQISINTTSKTTTGTQPQTTDDNDSRAKQSGNGEPVPDPGDTKKPQQVFINSTKALFANAGEEVLIPVNINDNVEIGSMGLTLLYDENLVSSIEVVGGSAPVHTTYRNGSLFITSSALERLPEFTEKEILKMTDDQDQRYMKEIASNSTVELNSNDALFYIKVTLSDNFQTGDQLSFEVQRNQSDVYFMDPNVVFMNLEVASVESTDNLASVGQNYPNPCADNTAINYTIAEQGDVTIRIFNAAGMMVQEITNENADAGHYTVQMNTSDLVSGIYYYTFTFQNNVNIVNKSHKMVIKK